MRMRDMSNVVVRKLSRISSAYILPLIITGCAVHPLPGDYTNRRINTFKIVKNVRCEAKFKVIEKIETLIKNAESLKGFQFNARQILNEDIIKKIKKLQSDKPENRRYQDDKSVWQIYPYVPGIIEKYKDIQIKYDFEFGIVEENDGASDASFTFPFTNGKIDFGFASGAKSKRDAKRKFVLTEKFGDLDKLACGDNEGNPYEFLSPNTSGTDYIGLPKDHILPLQGSIGMGETIETFLNLGALGGGNNASFTDTLIFTTTRKIDVNGKVGITIAPIKKINLVEASAKLNSKRVDTHKLTVTMVLPSLDTRSAQYVGQTKKQKRDTEIKTLFSINLQSCINKAESREDLFGKFREIPPEVYCSRFARQQTEIRFGVDLTRKSDYSRILGD